MRLVAGPSSEGGALERVHRVENWVSNLFIFFLLQAGKLSGQQGRKGGLRWVDVAWVGGEA